MIRRDAGHDFLLITQVDHAALSGQLAAHIGNSRFTRLSPLAMKAIAIHDAGWPLHDDHPTLNKLGFPLDVFEVSRETAHAVWTASADRAEAIDPYAGLLVSLHSLSLSIHASSTPKPPPKSNAFDIHHMHDTFAINKFQHREVERQEHLRGQLGFRMDLPLKHGLADANASEKDDQLLFDFRSLQAMDLLSLCLCCTHIPQDKTGEVLRRPTASPMQLRITKSLDGTLHVSPWPFDTRRIELTITARRLPGKKWESTDAFRQAYLNSEVEQLLLAIAM